jgi:hypothetical protein
VTRQQRRDRLESLETIKQSHGWFGFRCYGSQEDQTPVIDGRSFAPQLLGEATGEPRRPWYLTQCKTTRVLRDQRFKLYSTSEFLRPVRRSPGKAQSGRRTGNE